MLQELRHRQYNLLEYLEKRSELSAKQPATTEEMRQENEVISNEFKTINNEIEEVDKVINELRSDDILYDKHGVRIDIQPKLISEALQRYKITNRLSVIVEIVFPVSFALFATFKALL